MRVVLWSFFASSETFELWLMIKQVWNLSRGIHVSKRSLEFLTHLFTECHK